MGILTKEEDNREEYYKSSFKFEDNKINQITSKLNSLIVWLNQFYNKFSKSDSELKEINLNFQERIKKLEEKNDLNSSQINFEEIKSLREQIEKNKKNFVMKSKFKNFSNKIDKRINDFNPLLTEIEDIKLILSKVVKIAEQGKEVSKQNKEEIREIEEIVKKDLSKIIIYEEKVSSIFTMIDSLKDEIETLRDENFNLKKELKDKYKLSFKEVGISKKANLSKVKEVIKENKIIRGENKEDNSSEELEKELQDIKSEMNPSESNEVVSSEQDSSPEIPVNLEDESKEESETEETEEVEEQDDEEKDNQSEENSEETTENNLDDENIAEKIPQDSEEDVLENEEVNNESEEGEEKGFFKKGLEKLGFK